MIDIPYTFIIYYKDSGSYYHNEFTDVNVKNLNS